MKQSLVALQEPKHQKYSFKEQMTKGRKRLACRFHTYVVHVCLSFEEFGEKGFVGIF